MTVLALTASSHTYIVPLLVCHVCVMAPDDTFTVLTFETGTGWYFEYKR